MAKTSKQVQGDIYRLLRDSVLYTQITGEVYREGLRPRDSRKEDAVVIFTTGVPDEIETGVVTVNIYVPDIDPWHNGVMVEDVERTQQVERLAQEWVDSLTCEVSCYKFHLRQTIYTEEEADIRQIYDNEYVANAMMRLDEFSEYFDLKFDDEDVDTIGGLVVKYLGHIAKENDITTIGGFTFKVLETDGARIVKLKIKRQESALSAQENE